MPRQESPKQKLSITTDTTLITLPVMDTALENYTNLNATDTSLPESITQETVSENSTSGDFSGYGSEHNFYDKVEADIFVSMLVICSFGVLGNGIVFWLLVFRIQRNPFLTYILNLTVADLGVLLSLAVFVLSLWYRYIYGSKIVWIVSVFLFLLMYSSSQFLLTAISIDRCVAVFFPLWHQCKRPPRLSTIVCTVIWVVSFLLTAMSYTLYFKTNFRSRYHYVQCIVNAVLCVPIMTMATVALFIKVCFKAPQHRRGKLLTIILLTLLFFLFFAFPLNIVQILYAVDYYIAQLGYLTILFSSLNSSVNPVIYFLVGRQWKSQHKESLRMILQKAFKEEEGCSGQQETPVGTQL